MDHLNDQQPNQSSKNEIDWMKVLKIGGIGVGIYAGIILILVTGGLIFMLHGFYSLNQEVEKTHAGFKESFEHQFQSPPRKSETRTDDKSIKSENNSNDGDIEFGLIKPSEDSYK